MDAESGGTTVEGFVMELEEQPPVERSMERRVR